MTRMMTLLAGAALGMTLANPAAAQALRAGPACQSSTNPDDIIRRQGGGTCPAGYIRVRLVPATDQCRNEADPSVIVTKDRDEDCPVGYVLLGPGAAAAVGGGAAGAAGAVGGFGAAAAAGLAVAVVGVAVGGSSSGSH